jgi:Kelch motif
VTRLAALGLLVFAPLAAAGGGLGTVGSMATPRAAHVAAALPTGDVLVAGGCTTSGCEGETASAEIYRAGPRRFVAAAPMTRPRSGHVAVALRDGRVLVLGGWSRGRPSASAELYLPRANRWVATGSLSTARGAPTATRLQDGRVLVVGGTDGTRMLRSAELYDPRRGRFVPAGRLAVARAAHAAALLRDGRVLVVGGSNESGVQATAEAWSPRTRRFAPAGRMAKPRHKHAAVTLADGRVLVVGGSDDRDFRGRYDSAELWRAGRFTATGRMAHQRFKLPDAVVALRSGDVLVAGGATHVERYNSNSGRFGGRLPLGDALAFSTATELKGGYVLIAGGYDDSIRPTAHAWFYGMP